MVDRTRSSATDGSRPHIVMVVANDVSTDTRVRKMAHDLARAGPKVTVLGVSKSGRREDHDLGPARVTLLPVGDRLRSHRRLGRGFGRRHRLTKELELHTQNYYSLQRRVRSEITWLRDDYYAGRAARNETANRAAQLAIDGRENRSAGSFSMRLRRRLARLDSDFRKWRRATSEKMHLGRFERREGSINEWLKSKHRHYAERKERLERRRRAMVETGDRPDWRSVLPELHDYEVAFGPVLDSLRPDVIHAQDVHLLGVAARAVSRSIGAGHRSRLVYDSHEYIRGLAHPRPAKAWTNLEAEYVGRADAVITVAPAIAELLERDYHLKSRPSVVMNIPVPVPTSASLRTSVGLTEDDTLLVYSGGLDASRGVHTLVEAVGRIPEVHLALVSKAATHYTIELEQIAMRGGFRDRLHFAPFVQPQEVVGYLSSADIGVHTIIAGPINHEVTLPNKVFEYMHARLPIVISNCKAMSELVERLGVGAVFESENVDSLEEVLRSVLADPERYRSVYDTNPELLERYSWPTERGTLFDAYRRLLGHAALAHDLGEAALAPMSAAPTDP